MRLHYGMASNDRPVTGDPFLDEPEAMMALMQRSFAKAVRAAIAENDRLGIPSVGAVDGKIVWRYPPKPD